MNRTDFERAAGGRKVKYSFNFIMIDGRLQNKTTLTPLARELAALLYESELTKKLVKGQELEFSMSSDFQLSIKNNTPAAPVEAAPVDSSETPPQDD